MYEHSSFRAPETCLEDAAVGSESHAIQPKESSFLHDAAAPGVPGECAGLCNDLVSRGTFSDRGSTA